MSRGQYAVVGRGGGGGSSLSTLGAVQVALAVAAGGALYHYLEKKYLKGGR